MRLCAFLTHNCVSYFVLMVQNSMLTSVEKKVVSAYFSTIIGYFKGISLKLRNSGYSNLFHVGWYSVKVFRLASRIAVTLE